MLPEQRTKMLLKAVGWQGGTIHQLAEVTGCSVQDLLYAEPHFGYYGAKANEYRPTDDYMHGFSAGRTCTVEFNMAHNFPRNKGNLEYFFGVMGGLNVDDTGSSWVEVDA